VNAMSRRIGLRHMQSISGKPPLVCPSGEQITNGGFETGDFTGWTVGDPLTAGVFPGYILSPYEGAYLAALWAVNSLEQIFSAPIPVSCFKGTSTFQVATAWFDAGCPPIPPPTWQVEIEYTDGSSTVLDLTGDPNATWVLHNLKSILQSGKTVKGVKFTTVTNGVVYADACSLNI
jgi:hypothetical protein